MGATRAVAYIIRPKSQGAGKTASDTDLICPDITCSASTVFIEWRCVHRSAQLCSAQSSQHCRPSATGVGHPMHVRELNAGGCNLPIVVNMHTQKRGTCAFSHADVLPATLRNRHTETCLCQTGAVTHPAHPRPESHQGMVCAGWKHAHHDALCLHSACQAGSCVAAPPS